MFVHTVFFKFQNLNDRREAKARLLGMMDTVPSLNGIEVGMDEFGTERSWDMVLVTQFTDLAGYRDYAIDPAHQEVLKWLKQVISASATVDYSRD